MSQEEIVLFGALTAAILLLLVFLIRTWILVRRLHVSFAKLGHLVREDAKKYFDDAADKIVGTNEQFHDSYQKIVEEGTQKVISQSGAITDKALADAHAKGNAIILKAREDAQQIMQAAQADANAQTQRTLQRTADAISWTMSQYLGEEYSAADHEALIEKQIKKYVDEHRR